MQDQESALHFKMLNQVARIQEKARHGKARHKEAVHSTARIFALLSKQC